MYDRNFLRRVYLAYLKDPDHNKSELARDFQIDRKTVDRAIEVCAAELGDVNQQVSSAVARLESVAVESHERYHNLDFDARTYDKDGGVTGEHRDKVHTARQKEGDLSLKANKALLEALGHDPKDKLGETI